MNFFVIASPPKAGVAISIREKQDGFATARNDIKVASLLTITRELLYNSFFFKRKRCNKFPPFMSK
jgi:hypothetical protein